MNIKRQETCYHVMRITGHRDIKNILIYTHLIDFEGDEYNSAAVKKLRKKGIYRNMI